MEREIDTRSAALRIITTGGTIDKVHDVRTESLGFPPDGRSFIPRILEIGRCHFPVTQTVLQKDSLDFDEADRARISEAVARAPEEQLVIAHGTGTMGQTARLLAGLGLAKTIVLTGAMRPFSLAGSDAAFNLGGAILAAQLLPHGVWGVMNGRAIPAAELEKEVDSGRFDL